MLALGQTCKKWLQIWSIGNRANCTVDVNYHQQGQLQDEIWNTSDRMECELNNPIWANCNMECELNTPIGRTDCKPMQHLPCFGGPKMELPPLSPPPSTRPRRAERLVKTGQKRWPEKTAARRRNFKEGSGATNEYFIGSGSPSESFQHRVTLAPPSSREVTARKTVCATSKTPASSLSVFLFYFLSFERAPFGNAGDISEESCVPYEACHNEAFHTSLLSITLCFERGPSGGPGQKGRWKPNGIFPRAPRSEEGL